MSTSQLREVAPGVHISESPLRFLGLEIGARMTVLQLEAGLLIHSPIAVDPATVAHLGTPRWVLAPNRFHHLHMGPWIDSGIAGWAAPGLAKKRPDLKLEGVALTDAHPFGDEVALLSMTCFPMLNEVVLLHRPSRTLVVCDLVFNFAQTAPLATRLMMRFAGAYPGCQTSYLERIAFKREIARQELGAITGWDFDRVIMAHGEVIETGGRDALKNAFRWLGPLGEPPRLSA